MGIEPKPQEVITGRWLRLGPPGKSNVPLFSDKR